MNSLLELLGRQTNTDAPPSRPDMLAQAMELQDRYERFHNNPYTLKPGDFVMEKRGMGMLKAPVRSTILLILWRMLDSSSSFDQDLALQFASKWNVSSLDCVVAYVSDDAATLIFDLRAIAQLEPWAPAGGCGASEITDGADETAMPAAPVRDTAPPTAGDRGNPVLGRRPSHASTPEAASEDHH